MKPSFRRPCRVRKSKGVASPVISAMQTINQQIEAAGNSQSSGSIGVTAQLGAGGAQMGVTASASRGAGQGAGSGTSYTHTQVGGQSVQIESGGDTTLKGAVVSANQVSANVGGDLLIQTLQDSNRYNERQRNAGFNVSMPIGPGAASANLNAGRTDIRSNYQSATEQSGIRAGDGGFQVKVEGDTTLVGAAITSSEQAVQDNRNQFTTAGQSAQEALASGALTLADLNNHASYSANSVSVGLGAGAAQPGQSASAALSGVGIGRDSGSASSTTLAAISGLAGNTQARTGDASTGIGPIFDADKVRREVNAQVQITQEFGKQASKAVGDYASAQLKAARAAGDTEGMAAWAEGGKNRVALHTLVGGLTGGVQGALGAGAASAAAPAIEALQEQLQTALTDAGVGQDTANLIASLASGATAATIGGAAGGTAGAATAFNADMNNRQLHPSERQHAQRLAEQLAREGISGPDGQPYSAEQIEAQMRLMGVAAQTKPNTMEVLTSPEAIASALQNDPNLPLRFQGPAGVEQLGQPNWALQQHIISRSTPHPEVPSIYLPSVSAPTAAITPSATNSPTARCANGDLACITGVGQQQNAPLTQQTREAIADAAQTTSRGAGVVAAGATALAAQGGPYGRPAQGVAVIATGAGAAADVVEQLARPNLAASTENAFLLAIQTGADSVLPIAAPITNEVINAWKNSNTNLELKDWASIEWRKFLDSRSKP